MHSLEAKKYFYLNPYVPVVMERQAAKSVDDDDEMRKTTGRRQLSSAAVSRRRRGQLPLDEIDLVVKSIEPAHRSGETCSRGVIWLGQLEKLLAGSLQRVALGLQAP